LDAGDSNTVSFSSGSNVSQWNDKSGNGTNLGVGSGTTTYSSNGIQLSSSYMVVTKDVDLTNLSFFMVGVGTARILNQTIFTARPSSGFSYQSTSGFGVYFNNTDANKGYSIFGTDIDPRVIASASYDTFQNPILLSVTAPTSGFIQGWTNGTLAASSSNTMVRTSPAKGFAIGAEWQGGSYGNIFTSFIIREIIVYNSVLSTSQRQAVEGYLAAKWGLTSSLPATHPYKSLPPISRQFAPVDISGCVLWIDAADATTVTLSGNNITQLQDKSSNAYVFATASGFTYNVTKFNTSYPSFYSPTSTAGYSLGSNTSFTLNQPFTAFAVGGNLISPSSGGYFWDSTSNANRAALLSFSPGRPTMFAGVELFSVNSNSFTGALILTCQYNSTSSSIFENGSNTSSNTNVGTQNAVSLRLGAAWSSTTNWNGHICEILFFNRLMSTAERQQVEGYLANKWGLRGNLAASHPFKLYSALTPVFTPVQISGCSLWLDAADTTTMSFSSGSNVSQWNDKSGNGNNFTGVSNPQSGTATINGLNAIDVFTNSNAYFSNASISFSTPFSIFGVGIVKGILAVETQAFLGSATDAFLTIQFQFGNPQLNAWPRNAPLTGFAYNSGYTTLSTISNANVLLGMTVTAGSLPGLFLNGSQLSLFESSNAGSYTITGLQIARRATQANYWNGHIGEVLIYSGVLPTSQRQAVEGYLANKWGLVGNLPASHPYKKFRN
jgi:hypothetical protein